MQVNTTQVETQVKEVGKHYHNLREILRCSNATPILRRGAIGYVCSYCLQEYPEPADLKKHTLEEHTSKTDPTVGLPKRPKISEYNIKLDITNLECTECAKSIESLEDLLSHLQYKHDIKIYSDIPNHFIPFKFETEVLTCCLCPSTFDKFKTLQGHMHSHYKNYVCKDCDAGFVTRRSWVRHCSTHVKGDFPCSFCPKVYDTLSKKRSHERFNHIKVNVLPNRCTYCDKGFKEYYAKEKHMLEVHGVKSALYKCTACDKSYNNRRRLRVHVKRDHLLERSHKCPTCGMAFFSSHDVKKHILTHTGERSFQCEICLKSYGRKSTLTSHMRIHKDDRRFKCEFCGMSFIQKCSWKSHCKTSHGQTVE